MFTVYENQLEYKTIKRNPSGTHLCSDCKFEIELEAKRALGGSIS